MGSIHCENTHSLHLGLFEDQQRLRQAGVQPSAHQPHVAAVLLDVAHRLFHARHVRIEFQLKDRGWK